MGIPVLGEYQDNFTLEEAFLRYETIYPNPLWGGKGINFKEEEKISGKNLKRRV